MADKKISQLPVGNLTPESIFPIVSEGVTSQITFADIQDAIGSSSSLIVPIGDFLVFKIATGNSNTLEVGDIVQGIIGTQKIEGIYTGGSLTSTSSFDILNYINLVDSNELFLGFDDIDSTTSSLGIADKTNISDWNTYFFTKGGSVVFDSVQISGNFANLVKNNAGSVNELDLSEMQLTSVEFGGFDNVSVLALTNNSLSDVNDVVFPTNTTHLNLGGNNITIFNPTQALPDSLQLFVLSGNSLSYFNPTLTLPSTLTSLNLSQNQIDSDGWNNYTGYISALPNNGTLYASNNIDTIIGTTTESEFLGKSWTINS